MLGEKKTTFYSCHGVSLEYVGIQLHSAESVGIFVKRDSTILDFYIFSCGTLQSMHETNYMLNDGFYINL